MAEGAGGEKTPEVIRLEKLEEDLKIAKEDAKIAKEAAAKLRAKVDASLDKAGTAAYT